MKKQELFITLFLFVILLYCPFVTAQECQGAATLKVKKLKDDIVSAKDISTLFDKKNIASYSLNQVNWKEFPYKPEVRFRIAYTNNAILLNYRVKEKSIRAKCGEDTGPVWSDSCVELFISPTNDGNYYNIEANCIGTILMEVGKIRNDRKPVSKESISKIERWSSLGSEPFEEKVGDYFWELSLVIPYTVFSQSRLTSLDGAKAKANFYKCGDGLQTPHYLSWNKIDTKKPDFHRPEFFGTLIFE